MQDNGPKHVSHRAQDVFEDNGVNWWRTPPKSPDLNPIENLWHKLKEHLRAKVKPRTLEQLKGDQSILADCRCVQMQEIH